SLNDEADAIEEAVSKALLAGLRTADLTSPDAAPIGTSQMGDAVAKAIKKKMVK
ncbi:MAG: 3-isopropylmalate dehydrogenase, partial [Kiritimatiellae bacterium]|nr:3-isopropylmalate dehydrogenase [Kiritimatiellia bacterium]